MMENVGPKEGQDRTAMNKKLRSPVVGENNTMESFQDGGQQNMNPEQNEFVSPMDGARIKNEMNNYSGPPREGMMGPESYRMSQGMHPSQMQGYNPYMRENYEHQHGGMPMSGVMDFPNQNAPFPGQYSQPMRAGHPDMMKAGGQMPAAYNSPRNMLSGQSISQQSGPTPTLNQLLQNPNAPQRSQAGPGSYMDPQKGGGESGGPTPPYGMPPNWSNPRQMGMYQQNPMGSASPGFRNQV